MSDKADKTPGPGMVLIVDDDAAVRRSLENLFTSMGFRDALRQSFSGAIQAKKAHAVLCSMSGCLD
jgi:FixJ family two-component response regulator